MFNLSRQTLTDSEIKVLQKGLKFVPTPEAVDKLELRADILTLLYKLKWHFQFANNPNNDDTENTTGPLISIKTHGRAPPKPRDARQIALCNQLDKIVPVPHAKHKQCRNMNSDQYKALKSIMRKLDQLVIKEADKGSGVVIMSKDFYHQKISEMLQSETYTTADIDCSTLVKRTKTFIGRHKSQLHKKEVEAITKQEAYMAKFYGLPKIHKSKEVQDSISTQQSEVITCPDPVDLKFRPIVSCRDCPTRSLSELLDKLLRPFVEKVRFRIKDTWDFLRKLPQNAEAGDFTVTADISSLYTNISTDKGEAAILYYCEKYPSLLPARFNKTFVVEMYRFCQDNLYFRYNNTAYRQTSGTGMGRIYAPSIADLKQGYDEIQLEQKMKEIFAPQISSFFLQHYGRYLDDIHFRWKSMWVQHLEAIKNLMNSIDPLINYEFESSADNEDNSIPFLDVCIILRGTQTITDVFAKKTDTFNYVPFSSSHPRHTIRNIPFSLARRIRGIVSDPSILAARFGEMKKRLLHKKYPLRLINEAIRCAQSLSRDSLINPPPKIKPNETNNIFFVSTYNPTIKDPIGDIRRSVEIYNSTQNEQSKKINVVSSYRKGSSLKDMLMFKKNIPTGVFGCKDGCILCTHYLHTGDSLELKNGSTLTANEHFDCLSRNLLYVAVCSGCQETYLGETGDQLSTRFAVHRQQSKLNADIQAVKADQHFRICGGDKYKVFPFKRLKKNCTIYRRVVEDYNIKQQKPTLNGLSIFQPNTG